MKRVICIVCFLVLFCLFNKTVFAQRNPVTTKTGTKNIPNTQQTPLVTAVDTAQYTYGAFLAQWLNSNGFTITNANLFIRGMDDYFQKKLVYHDSTISSRMLGYQNSLQRERALAQENALFASLRTRQGIGLLPSGVRFLIKKPGRGLIASDADTLIIHMIAKLADNVTIVENTYETQKPFVTTLQGLFAGLKEPMQMMPSGSVWQLFIPSALAYGDNGTAKIPPNSALILEVELMEIRQVKK